MLTTVDLVKDELRQSGETAVAADEDHERFILDRIDAVDTLVPSRLCFGLVPTYSEVTIDLFAPNSGLYDRYTLLLPQPLISASEVLLNGVEVIEADYDLESLVYGSPYGKIVKSGGDGWIANEVTSGRVVIKGFWGWRSPLIDAWVDTLDTLQVGINASVITLSVSDVTGKDARLRKPRFSPGQLLRIEDEYLQVREVAIVDAAADTLKVTRGALGSTAAVHAIASAIESYRPDSAIEQAATRWVGLMYQRRGEYEKTTITDLGTVEWPSDMPDDVKAIFESYRDMWG